MKKFTHLHTHTEFSLLDGVARINKLVETAKNQGAPAVAITDHGNMFGVFKFYKECLKNNINPIVGCEFYCAKNTNLKTGRPDAGHLVLLAKNEEGYHNLLKLQSFAFLEGFYYKPRINYEILEKHSKGLICLSGCLAGHIPQHLLNGENESAENLALRLKNMFDDGDFYIEIQNHGIPEQIEVLPKLDALAKKIGVKTVATNDAHYIGREDAEMQDVLMCVQMGKFFDDPTRMKFSTDEFYMKTYDEMAEALEGFTESLDVTNEIAEKCHLVIKSKAHEEFTRDEEYILPAVQNFIPEYVPENGMEKYEFLEKLAYEGIVEKYGEITPLLKARAVEELSSIKDLGFVDYFLVVWDYINFARENGIPVGPGRGSGAGSLIAYAISITLIDPIKYDLIFERFINRERVSMPDFDVDFCMDRRHEVVEYVRRKYTPENVSLIATFGTMAAKNAIRDVSRVLKLPLYEVEKLTKPIPAKLPDGIKKPPVLKFYFGTTGKPENEKFIIPELRELYENDVLIKKIVDMAIKLEGVPRNVSTHAAGVLITPGPVDNFVAVAKSGEDVVSQASMIELEELGLLKYDFLGLRTLTDIEKTIKLVEKSTGKRLDFYDMEYDDQGVFEMISNGETDAVFQLESQGMKKFMKQLKPNCMEDIIAGISLYRPGPMDYIPRYVHNKENPQDIEFADPCLKEILRPTYGVIVYQEQVMKIVQVMGGFSFGQADNVRRIMGKKKKDKMVYEKEKFINGYVDPLGKKSISGALAKGISKEVAETVWGEMESFASYAFNKSHAAAYAYISYQTAYLKKYHFLEFLCSVINNRIINIDDIKKYAFFARSTGVELLQPDVNHSDVYFMPENGAIRFGLAGLKNVGIGAVEMLIAEREKGEFLSFEDFISRVDSRVLNKRCLESLIFAGAFDSFGQKRSQLSASFELIISKKMADKKKTESGQFSFFGAEGIDKIEEKPFEFPNIKEFTMDEKLKREKDIVGIYLSGHPLDNFADEIAKFNFNSSMIKVEEATEEIENDGENIMAESNDENEIADGTQVTCGGIILEINKVTSKRTGAEMGIVKIEDVFGTFDCMLFSSKFAKYKNMLREDLPVSVSGKFSKRDGQAPIILADVFRELKVQEKGPKIKQTLFMRFNLDDEKLYAEICEILAAYPGTSDVIVQCTSKNKAFKLPFSIRVSQTLKVEISGKLEEKDFFVKEVEC